MRPPSMNMEKLTDFLPYENTAILGMERSLKWCNETIIHAIAYGKSVCGDLDDYDKIMVEIHRGTLRVIQALLYGALKAADPKMTIKRYQMLYKPARLQEYVVAVLEGMNHYLPEPAVADSGVDLDPEWPDTQAEVKKKTVTNRRTGDSGSGSVGKTISAAKNFSSKRCGR